MSTGKKQKRMRDTPVFYDEVKVRKNVMITPSSWEKLKAKASQAGTSVSEVLEQIIRDLDD